MRPLIVANWKMNPKTGKEAKRLFNLVKRGMGNIKNVEVVICSPFVYLPKLFDFFGLRQKSQIKLGAQDVFWEEKGAFTGEISPLMLKNLGVRYVILGHSERRQYLGETDEMLNKKIKAVISEKLNPILCIGESQKERNQGKTSQILKEQLVKTLYKIPATSFKKIKFSIAYEPIWAIGTGNACDIDEAMTGTLLIRKTLTELYNSKIARKILILYGGSVSQKNGGDYIKLAGMDGLLVGGASLKPREFIGIIKSID